MSDVGTMVAELIAAGCAPEVAAQVVASAFVAGAASANFRGIPVDETAEKRRAYDRLRKRKSTGIPPESAGPPEVPISTKTFKKVDRHNRGSRITPDWTPSDAERSFAKQEGFSDTEIDREVGKFRDHWAATAGAKGVKLDWSATWRKWIRTAAGWAGKAPPAASGAVVVGLFYAKAGSEQLDAWDTHSRASTGKSLPRDKNQGWHVKSEWPPGYVREKPNEAPPGPILRTMQ